MRRKIAVVGILALIGVGVPAVFVAESAISDVRNEARMAQSGSNMRKISDALLAYVHTHHGAWPASLDDLSSGDRSLSPRLICPKERGKYVYHRPALTDPLATVVVFESGGRNPARQGVIVLHRDGTTAIEYGTGAERISAQN